MEARRKRRSADNRVSVPGCTIFLLMGALALWAWVGTGSAAEKMVYKGPKPIKEAAQSEKQGTEADESDVELLGGYSYDPRGKVDPFKPFIAEEESVDEKKKKEPKTYLETLDLSQLQLTAIVMSPKGNYAMVRDAKGLGYVIRKGTPIGTKGGVVQEVKEKEVIVREEYRNFKGEIKTKEVAKKLHE